MLGGNLLLLRFGCELVAGISVVERGRKGNVEHELTLDAAAGYLLL